MFATNGFGLTPPAYDLIPPFLQRPEPPPTPANIKAIALLESVLDAAQLQEWQAKRSITVVGQLSHNHYTLRYTKTMNVTCYTPDGTYVGKYCIVPIDPIPLADQLLAQMLMLTANEAYFLATAKKDTIFEGVWPIWVADDY